MALGVEIYEDFLNFAHLAWSASIAMTLVQTKKFNWLPTPTAWEDAQAWRERRRAMMEQFEVDAVYTATSLSTTMADQIDGMAEIAARVAVKRVQDAAKAKHDKFLSSLGAVNKTA